MSTQTHPTLKFFQRIKTHGHMDTIKSVTATGGNKLLIDLDAGVNTYDCTVPNAANVQIEFDYSLGGYPGGGAHDPLEVRSVGQSGTIILQNPADASSLSFHSTTPIVGSIMTPGGGNPSFSTGNGVIHIITFTIFSRNVDSNPYALINYVGGFEA
tara:strand:- start:255 stop:722 length:468 start_codon:yes stop_codon:yes gene_type:complete